MNTFMSLKEALSTIVQRQEPILLCSAGVDWEARALLAELPDRKLKTIHSGLELMVRLLNAQKLPPKLLLSQEVNVPKPIDG